VLAGGATTTTDTLGVCAGWLVSRGWSLIGRPGHHARITNL
jgi:hypothetical protein